MRRRSQGSNTPGRLLCAALVLGGGFSCNAILDNPEGKLVPVTAGTAGDTGTAGTEGSGANAGSGATAGDGSGATSGSAGSASGGDAGTPGGGDSGAAGDAGASGSGGSEECSRDEDCEELLPETTPEACALAECDTETGRCVFTAKDADEDGHAAKTCAASGVEIAVGDDCDDGDDQRFPGNWDGPEGEDGEAEPDRCDEIDQDCDGTADNDSTEVSGETKSCACDPENPRACYEYPNGTPIDAETLGNAPCAQGVQACEAGVPGACMGAVGPENETCNDIDDDCDGVVDDNASGSVSHCKDEDEDGYCTNDCVVACAPPPGFRAQNTCLSGLDCNDDAEDGASIHPGADELCGDGVDGNCGGGDSETFENLGDACVNGTYGYCRRTGTYVCSNDGQSTVCNGATVVATGEHETAATDSDIDLSTIRSDYDPRWDYNCDNAVTYSLGSQGLWEGLFRSRACAGNYEYACNYLSQGQCQDGVLGSKFFVCAATGVPGVCGQVVSYVSCLYEWYEDNDQCDYITGTYEANNQTMACQ
jgi:hypothetical protein